MTSFDPDRQSDARHIPVMLAEVLSALDPKDGEIYVDGTFGAGGYTTAILGKADCKVIAVDRDDSAYATAQSLAKKYDGRLVPVHGAFGDVAAHLDQLSVNSVDGLVLDIGVSSMQIDDAARGFSFAKDGPLDMRMDRDSGMSARDVVNNYDEKELADIIYKYGEERQARKVAAAIVKARTEKPIETTLELATIVTSAMPASFKKFAIHPATRTFQALRIYVNGELDQLQSALDASLKVLKAGGRLVVVSFHSLEDSIVKSFLRGQGPQAAGSRHLPEMGVRPIYFKQTEKKAIAPTDAESSANPRARSAKLRFAVRTDERMAA